jgi:hypothetical protein
MSSESNAILNRRRTAEAADGGPTEVGRWPWLYSASKSPVSAASCATVSLARLDEERLNATANAFGENVSSFGTESSAM